jgi:hypothetical protein
MANVLGNHLNKYPGCQNEQDTEHNPVEDPPEQGLRFIIKCFFTTWFHDSILVVQLSKSEGGRQPIFPYSLPVSPSLYKELIPF